MVKSVKGKFRLIPAVVRLGINVLILIEEAFCIGNWAGVKLYFRGRYSKQDVLFSIWGIARRYLDLGEYNYYLAIMITLKQIFKKFGE